MSEFIQFKQALRQKLEAMSSQDLFRVDVDKDLLWQTYLDSFPEGTNPIINERTEHDCQSCKQFIRSAGGIVLINHEYELVSIWDVEVGGHQQIVADAMAEVVKAQKIRGVLLHPEKHLGADYNHKLLESGETIKYNHFHFVLPEKFVKRGLDMGGIQSKAVSTKDVFKRGLDEISLQAIETVLELIDQNSLYRGEEHKAAIDLFLKRKKEYELLPLPDGLHDNYAWAYSVALGAVARIRNTSIGTLMIDLSEGVELDQAVRKFEAMVAPTNYKRPTALITKAMIKKAQDKVEELGFGDSLQRRYAVTEDITVNNVLYADRNTAKSMKPSNVFEELADGVPDSVGDFSKVEEVSVETFIGEILPKADSLELMLENKHTNNLMSLIAPINEEAKHMFKWHNNFSWAYNGEVADSMKERVKKAGGNVEGVLRFSIQWNDGDDNQNDFDAHCIEPNGNRIHFPVKRQIQRSSGMLDVDIINPGKNIAVENITWTDKSRMQEGRYELLVHNYSHNGGRTGFTAEIEYDGKIYSYEYAKELRQGEKVLVATLDFSQENGIEFFESLPSTHASKEVWNVATHKFHKVAMVMNSPNHWDDRAVGNKHLFFILEGCKNDGAARGFFNEFLKEDLNEHRKVFEVLGSKMKTEESDSQLSGLGFSSTQRNHVFCKVTGSFNRVIKINF